MSSQTNQHLTIQILLALTILFNFGCGKKQESPVTHKVEQKEQQKPVDLNGHTAPVNSVAFSPDGKRVVTASVDKTVKVWDATMGKEIVTLEGHSKSVESVCFSPNGKRIISTSREVPAKIWDAKTGQEVLTIHEAAGPIAFSSGGNRIVSGRPITIWNAETGKKILSIKEKALSIALSPDDKWIVSGSTDPRLKIWDARTGRLVRSFVAHPETHIHGVAFSPDGKRIVSGSSGNYYVLDKRDDPGLKKIKIWDAETGEELFTLAGQQYVVTCVAFSPDGKLIASGSQIPFHEELSRKRYGGELKVWDAAKRVELHTLMVGSVVTDVAFSPDGKRLVSAGDDVKIWTLASIPSVNTDKN